jgi:hypothetical protein
MHSRILWRETFFFYASEPSDLQFLFFFPGSAAFSMMKILNKHIVVSDWPFNEQHSHSSQGDKKTIRSTVENPSSFSSLLS